MKTSILQVFIALLLALVGATPVPEAEELAAAQHNATAVEAATIHFDFDAYAVPNVCTGNPICSRGSTSNAACTNCAAGYFTFEASEDTQAQVTFELVLYDNQNCGGASINFDSDSTCQRHNFKSYKVNKVSSA